MKSCVAHTSPSFLIVNEGSHAGAGPTPLWGKRGGVGLFTRWDRGRPDMELFLGSTSRTAAVLKLTAAISIKRPTECMVCMEALRNVRFACGHLACCEKCTAECAVGLSIPRACSLNAAYRLRGS